MGDKHRGAPRRYWCSEVVADGKLVGTPNPGFLSNGCSTAVLRNDETIPRCPKHDKLMVKTRYKRVEERQFEVMEKAQIRVGRMAMWSDEGRRKAKCHLCQGVIEPGERRVAFEAPPNYGASTTMAGGVITSIRNYVHAACLVDMLYGGQAGEGCPGCSAKILHDEFMSIREILEKRHG